MRHLYAASSEPGVSYLIDKAKLFERRRCNHLPEDYPEPLSAVECLSSVVDPKGSKRNPHRYVVASQELEVRKAMRSVMGVPLVYINRSVMIMEPMAEATTANRDRDEKSKFRDGLKGGRGSGSQGMKRKRGDDETGSAGAEDGVAKKKKVHGKGPKGPNPLAVKKSKKVVEGEGVTVAAKKTPKDAQSDGGPDASMAEGGAETDVKKKRRRKHKPGPSDGEVAPVEDSVQVTED